MGPMPGLQALSEKRRAAALKHREREGRHHDSYSPEAIKRRRDMRRATKEPWDLIAQAEALIESKGRT